MNHDDMIFDEFASGKVCRKILVAMLFQKKKKNRTFYTRDVRFISINDYRFIKRPS